MLPSTAAMSLLLVPKLRLGTCLAKLCFAAAVRDRARGGEAELRTRAFPSRAWEREGGEPVTKSIHSLWEIACMSRRIFRITPWLLALAIVSVGPSVSAVRAQPSAEGDDEQTLLTAGLATDGPALLAFFHARSRIDIDRERLGVLIQQLASSNRERSLATAELLGMGPLAVPILRRAANDLEMPE